MASRKVDGKLSQREAAFVAEYLKDRNGTQAYLRATNSKGTEKAARVEASRLLAKSNVEEAVRAGLAQLQKKAEFKAEQVARAMKRAVLYDVRSLFTSEGNLIPPNKWGPDLGRTVQSVKCKTRMEKEDDGTYTPYLEWEFKFPDRNAAISNAAKFFGMNKPERVEHEAGESLRALLERAAAAEAKK